MLINDDMMSRLNTIFQDILDDDELQLLPETSAKDVDGWDSLAHVRLILTVEQEFGVKFSAAEIGRLKNVGDLSALIRSKSAA